MKPTAKLIKTIKKSWMPTIHPVYYYGMPDNHVWVVYVTPCGKSGFYVNIDVVKNFKYDYEKEVWIKPIPNEANILNIEKDIDRLAVCGKSIAIIQIRRSIFPPSESKCISFVEKLFTDTHKPKAKPSIDKKQSTIKRNKWQSDQK